YYLFSLIFNRKLFTTLILKEKRLHHILDISIRIGIWVINFIDEYLETKVLGVNLSPH
ncbi:hypothetical protein F5882DRAFT_292175, partial [Hyaloscypha sp. PMI_1271]